MSAEMRLSVSPAPQKAICVFCGSAVGRREAYAEVARTTGRLLAQAGVAVVTGGGSVGLMGAIADGALEIGGTVFGVIPEALAVREIAHTGLTALHVVSNMHERKSLMAQLSGAFLTLPGGIGTYEEFFEILSWAALGLHAKPLGLLNIDGYFDPLIELLRHGVDEGFIRPAFANLIVVGSAPGDVVTRLIELMATDASESIDTEIT